jgi:hypothetical protein
MVVVIRVVTFAVLLILALVAVSLVIGIFRPETGGLEKLVLAILTASCVALGAAARSGAGRLQQRATSR